MKLLKCELTNFGSYKHLEFDFSDLGLCLLHGSTGSGKSTLQDAAAWCLYAITAKNGGVDEIRSWDATEPTIGTLEVELPDGVIKVTRIRGKTTQNDLYWVKEGIDARIRGRDLVDSQKLLEGILGVSRDLFIAGAYYNEFSPTGGFFTAKAKDRRELFEKLADLSLAKTIQERSTNVRKDTKKELADKANALAVSIGRIEQLKSSYKDSNDRRIKWETDRVRHIAFLIQSIQDFEASKEDQINHWKGQIEKFEFDRLETEAVYLKRLTELEQKLSKDNIETCTHCGQQKESVISNKSEIESVQGYMTYNENQANPYTGQLAMSKAYNNPYNEQLEAENQKVNPFLDQSNTIEREFEDLEDKQSLIAHQVDTLNHKIMSLGQLIDLSSELRGVLLVKSIKDIEDTTNRYLETYFDADLRVGFTLDDSDDLQITIGKNGHMAVYTQLSKGQRQLLKLTFSIAVMGAAANTAGIHFGCVFFDEALDGLDADLKVKAFSLFSELEKTHESILVVEHSNEFKQLFARSFEVTMQEDTSTIHES